MSPESQNARILAALKKGEAITPLDALHRWACFRLSARIYNLRQMGHKIRCDIIELPNGKRVGQYWMPELAQRPRRAIDAIEASE